MRRAAACASALLVLVPLACTIPQTLHDLDQEAPPPEFGRPALVRTAARVGAWIGAVGGAVVAVAALPVTYPITLLAEEPLGYSADEFLLAPIAAGASLGHFLVGAPPDMLHFVAYRAWVDKPRDPDFWYTPAPPPLGARRAQGPPTPAEAAPAEGGDGETPAETAPGEATERREGETAPPEGSPEGASEKPPAPPEGPARAERAAEPRAPGDG